jgi:type VI secretion system secreted protein Hcp
MKNAIRIAHLVAAAAALTVAGPASAEDVFIKLDGIEGESTHKDHKGEIEVFSYSWGTSRGASGAPGDMRGGAAKSCVSEFHFMKMLDKSSAAIVGNSIGSSPIPKATLTMARSGEGEKAYFTFTLTNVLVSSYQMSGSSERAMESVSLRFGSAEMSYKPQDDKGGLGGETKVMLKVGNCT